MAIYPIVRRPLRHAIPAVAFAVALAACSASTVGSEEPDTPEVIETTIATGVGEVSTVATGVGGVSTTTTVQPATTAASGAGEVTEETSVDCRSLAGSVWESVEEHEIGLNRDGELVYGQWSLTFRFQAVVWMYSDVKDTLTYECADDVLSGETDGRAPTQIAGRLLNRGEATQLEWDGLLYELVSLAEPFPLPDPDEVAPQSAEEALLFGVGVVQTLLAGDADGWRALTAETLVDPWNSATVTTSAIDAVVAADPFPDGSDYSGYTIDDYLAQYEPKVMTLEEAEAAFELDFESALVAAGLEMPAAAFLFSGTSRRSDAPGFMNTQLLFFFVAHDGDRWSIATLLPTE